MKHSAYIIPIMVFTFIAVFIFFIIKGGARMHSESKTLKSECNATQYYTIGDKGHLNQIYDCTGVDFL